MKALVTGVAGFLGGRLAAAALDRGWDVVGTFNRVDDGPDGLDREQMDLSDPLAIRHVVQKIKPAVILHAAAMARPDDCAADPARCQAVNVDGTATLAKAAAEFGAHMVFVSTDLVYDGSSAPYGESATPNPLGIYGRSKLNAENACADASGGKATLARTVLMYGAPASAGRSFVSGLVETLRSGKSATVFSDQIRTPIEAGDLCEALLRCAEKKTAGIIHIAGPESLSRLAFALKACEAFRLDPALLVPGLHAKTNFPDPRPMDVSMEIKRMREELNLEPADPSTGLARMAGPPCPPHL